MVSGRNIRSCFPLETPIGPVVLTFEDEYLTGLSFLDGAFPETPVRVPYRADKAANKAPNKASSKAAGKALERARRELDLYFQGKLREFSVPLKLSGPPFYMRVWHALTTIPFGETRTYRQVAAQVGSPEAFRAVGNACAANPIAIIVPCHRVVAVGGLAGYGGGLHRKEWLLRHEFGR